jgi:hypothetical protein
MTKISISWWVWRRPTFQTRISHAVRWDVRSGNRGHPRRATAKSGFQSIFRCSWDNGRMNVGALGLPVSRTVSPPPLPKRGEAMPQDSPTESFAQASPKDKDSGRWLKVLALGGMAVGALTGCVDSGPPDPVTEVVLPTEPISEVGTEQIQGQLLTDQNGRHLYADDGIDLRANGNYMVGTNQGLQSGRIGHGHSVITRDGKTLYADEGVSQNEQGQFVAGTSRGVLIGNGQGQSEILQVNGKTAYADEGNALNSFGQYVIGTNRGIVMGQIGQGEPTVLKLDGKTLYADEGMSINDQGQFVAGTNRGVIVGDVDDGNFRVLVNSEGKTLYSDEGNAINQHGQFIAGTNRGIVLGRVESQDLRFLQNEEGQQLYADDGMDINDGGQVLAGSNQGVFKLDSVAANPEFLKVNGKQLYANDGIDDEDDEDPEWIDNLGAHLNEDGRYLVGTNRGWATGTLESDDVTFLEHQGKRLYPSDGGSLQEDGSFLIGTNHGLMEGDLTP